MELLGRALIQTILYDILSLGTLGFSAQSVEIIPYDKMSESRDESSYFLKVLYDLSIRLDRLLI